jgi:transcriptional regulator NrdR family protein
MKNLKVIKKDDREEKFDPDKIIEACKAAGASDEIAKHIAKEISEELPKVESSKIRDLVLEKLEKLDLDAHREWLQFDIREKQK